MDVITRQSDWDIVVHGFLQCVEDEVCGDVKWAVGIVAYAPSDFEKTEPIIVFTWYEVSGSHHVFYNTTH
jgi:hypothetical protein